MKKLILVISLALTIGFMGCGGGGDSSDEAKELLQKMLQLVGIPQDIVANVCQDKNKNGICEELELQAKVTIKRGDDIDDIWAKITQTQEGRYFLETYDATLPILLELQDASKVDFDDGKFTLVFDGFATKAKDETKELSILESMVDADALTKSEADRFRTLQNQEAQDKFYAVLLSDLESNINTLREKGLDSQTAVRASIKEMADETKTNLEQADKINSCGSDQSCVDIEIEKVSNELIITEEESNQIIQSNSNQTPTTPVANGGETQNGKWVKPSQSDCEGNGGVLYNSDCKANWENAKTICSAIGDELPTIETLRAVVTDCGGIVNDYEYNEKNEAYQTCYKKKGFIYYYWSSTTHESYSSFAWSVNFPDGKDYESPKEYEFYVRCIRGE